MRTLIQLLLNITFVILYSVPAFAAPKPALSGNMTYYDVLRLWGPPSEKIEQEGKRQDIWIYDEAKVIFDQGKVVVWENEGVPSDSTIAVNTEVIKNKNTEPVEAVEHDEAVEQILKDIMGEAVEEGSNAPNPGLPANPPPNVLNLGRPIPIPPLGSN